MDQTPGGQEHSSKSTQGCRWDKNMQVEQVAQVVLLSVAQKTEPWGTREGVPVPQDGNPLEPISQGIR